MCVSWEDGRLSIYSSQMWMRQSVSWVWTVSDFLNLLFLIVTTSVRSRKKKKSVFEFGVVQKFANIAERCNEPSKNWPCNNWWSFMLMTFLTIEERQCPSASESLGRIWILFYVDWINFGSQNRGRRALFFLLLSCAEILPYYFFARWCFQGVRKHEKTKPIANCRQPSAVFVSFWNEESADPTFDAGKVRKCPVWVSSFVWVLVAKVEEDKLIKPTELSFCSSCVHIRLHFILPSVILFKAAATVFAADPILGVTAINVNAADQI